jgi:F420-dependent oxidoreductase-like protein
MPRITLESCFECWITLTHLAAKTQRIRLGTIVTCNSYRHPSLLAKIASVVDVISNGRLEFGIGAGWYDHEYKGYGFEFEKSSVRIKKLREAVQIIRKMWTEDKVDFDGKYYHLEGAINMPKPLQKPTPPITIGGQGEHLALRVVAELADKWNLTPCPSIEDYKRKVSVLEKHCLVLGRNPADIEKTLACDMVVKRTKGEVDTLLNRLAGGGLLSGNYKGDGHFEIASPHEYSGVHIVGTPHECVDKIKSFEEVGVGYFIFSFPIGEQIESMRILAEEIIPRVA